MDSSLSLGLENTVLSLASQLWSDVLWCMSMEETITPPVISSDSTAGQTVQQRKTVKLLTSEGGGKNII